MKVLNTAVYITRSEGLLELGHEVSIVGHQDGFKNYPLPN
jgi:hypothetical protein